MNKVSSSTCGVGAGRELRRRPGEAGDRMHATPLEDGVLQLNQHRTSGRASTGLDVQGKKPAPVDPVPSPGAGAAPEDKNGKKSIVESKLVANIGPLTDDKDSYRQWDEKMVNVLTHLNKAYGPAIACIKDLVDRGRGPDGTYTLPDTHRGVSPDLITSASAVASLTLAEMVKSGVQASDGHVDTDQLDEDLSFILVDKAKLRSEILHRI